MKQRKTIEFSWRARDALIRAVLALNGIAFLFIGGAALLWPRAFGSFTGGIVLTTSSAVQDFQAIYGGLQIAVAIAFLLFAVTRSPSQFRPGLLLAVLVPGGLSFGRIWGMVADGRTNPLSLRLLAPELIGVVLNIFTYLYFVQGSKGTPPTQPRS